MQTTLCRHLHQKRGISQWSFDYNFHENLSLNNQYYSRDPIKQAARLTIFQVFFRWIGLNRACSLNYFNKIFHPDCKSTPKYEYFLSKLTDFTLVYDCIVIFYCYYSCFQGKKALNLKFQACLLNDFQNIFHPARSLN